MNQRGQTLVTLLVFVVMATAIATTAVAVIINTTQSTFILEKQTVASQMAASGIENAMLRLLRNPDYTGETLPVGTGIVTINVTGTTTKTITATAQNDEFVATYEATASYVDYRLTVTAWHAVY